MFLVYATAPASIANILSEGPKYATEPLSKPPEMLSLVRRISERPFVEKKGNCVVDCVGSLRRYTRKSFHRFRFGPIVSFFKDSGLKLLVSDKEVRFVVVPLRIFKETSTQAVSKKFIPVPDVVLAKAKTRA